MVTIMGYALRKGQDEKEFYALILQGGIELVKSKKTERYYATLKKASISSTFDEATCKASIGQQFPGSIQKQSCEPYTFVVKETGEIMEFNYRWSYVPEGTTLEEVIHEGMPLDEASFSHKPEGAIFLR
jgi:hypothetical protein